MTSHALRMAGALFLSTGLMASSETPQPLPFTGGGWQLRGKALSIEPGENGGVLRIENGEAYRRDVALLDGAIDFEVQVTNRRSFVYLMFRMATDQEYEAMSSARGRSPAFGTWWFARERSPSTGRPSRSPRSRPAW